MDDVRTLVNVQRRRAWARRWVAMRRLSQLGARQAAGYAALGAAAASAIPAVRGLVEAVAEVERRELIEKMWEQA